MILKKNQSGRSMVEMLGVLAIIGVLSIGGIAGYRVAMNHKKANDIINDVMIEVTNLSTQVQNNAQTLSLINNETSGGYPLEASYVQSGEQNTQKFLVVVKEVPSEVCRVVAEAGWTVPYEMSVIATAGEEVVSGPDSCGTDENVDLEFYFNSTLSNEK